MNILAKLLDLVVKLFSLSETISKAERGRRERIATLFDAIASCLDSVGEALGEQRVPHGACAEMLTYAREMAAVVAPVLGQERADELAAILHEAHNVEGMLEIRSTNDFEKNLARLAEISGQFRALSKLTLAAP